ncbi:MAG: outer membrane protein assembly factor BamC, partial [Sterolibacterium sp.]
IMETDWAENRAKLPQDFIRRQIGKVFDSLYSTPERDKFRTRLEKGGETDTTEIYISHRGMSELYIGEGKSETRWQPRPADPELEAEMLGRLMVRLGSTEEQATALLAEEAKSERAKLTTSADGGGTLQLQEAFDRSWRRVGLVLDRVGFTVEDRDRAQGMYFVRYVDPEVDNSQKDDPGFLSRLAFWSTKKDPGQLPQFRIHVKGNADASTVQVLTREGGADKSETAKKILKLLLDQLK